MTILNKIYSLKDRFLKASQDENKDKKKLSGFANRLLALQEIVKHHTIVHLNEHLNAGTSILDRSVRKETTENFIVKSVKDLFTFTNKAEIKHLMSMGYTRSESIKIIDEIYKSTTYISERAERIKDYPSKIQKEKGYTSQSQYKDDRNSSVVAIKKLGYIDGIKVEQNVEYAQEVSESREQFLKIIQDTPSADYASQGYKTRTTQKKYEQQATDILLEIGCKINSARSKASRIQKKYKDTEFIEALDTIKQNIVYKDEALELLINKGYDRANARDVFIDLAMKLPHVELLETINNLPNLKNKTTKLVASDKRTESLNILGLQEKATDREITVAYRKLAKKFHPDKNDSKGIDEVFKKILAAYEFLTNKRQ
jgi:hypothetical protein